MLHQQLLITDALIRFRGEHGMNVPEELRLVRQLLAEGNSSEAEKIARRLSIFGQDGLNATPSPIHDEDSDYCRVLHESILRNWILWLSITTDPRDAPFLYRRYFGISLNEPTPV